MICRSRCSSELVVRKYVSRTIASDPATNSVAYHRPRRRPNAGSNPSRTLLSDDITHAANGLQTLGLEGRIDLVAQPADQHVDDVGLGIEVVVPDVRQDHRLRDDLPGVSHEVLEEGE